MAELAAQVQSPVPYAGMRLPVGGRCTVPVQAEEVGSAKNAGGGGPPLFPPRLPPGYVTGATGPRAATLRRERASA